MQYRDRAVAAFLRAAAIAGLSLGLFEIAMDTEHDQFEQVRRLLALKRHEQPPPRYFHEFSGKVIARLHALEAAQPATWRQRLGLDFNFKPALIGVFGFVACGLLLVGVVTSLGVSQPG